MSTTNLSLDCPAPPNRPSPGARAEPGPVATLFWIVIWLMPLLDSAVALPDAEPFWPALVGLAAFVVLYVAVLWTAFCWPTSLESGAPSRLQLAGLAALTVVGVALAAGYGEGPGDWLFVLLYVGVAGAAVLPRQQIAVGWLAGTVVTLFVVARLRDVPSDDLASVVLSLALAGVVVLMLRRMTELIAHLRSTQAELAETAVRAERLRFSRDLHDLLGHTLSLIVVKAEVAKRSCAQDPTVAAREAGEIEQIGRQALSEVREAVTGYRGHGFTAELDTARSTLAGAGLDVTVRTTDAPLPATADHLLGWVVREATTNVVRHSRARSCNIEVRRVDGQVTLEVRDDGRGGFAEPLAAGHGLRGLAERLNDAGGQLEAGPTETGWRVVATLPTTPPEATTPPEGPPEAATRPEARAGPEGMTPPGGRA